MARRDASTDVRNYGERMGKLAAAIVLGGIGAILLTTYAEGLTRHGWHRGADEFLYFTAGFSFVLCGAVALAVIELVFRWAVRPRLPKLPRAIVRVKRTAAW